MDIQQDSTHIPHIEDFSARIHNQLFEKFLPVSYTHLVASVIVVIKPLSSLIP